MDIVIDPRKADSFFFNLRTGFAKNLTEILIGVGLVLFIFLLFIIFYAIQKRKALRKENEELALMYGKLRDKYHLSQEDEGLIEGLFTYAKEPRKKYLLLSDQAAFNGAFAAMREKLGSVSRDSYNALIEKLGFKPLRRAAAFASTRDLPLATRGVLTLSKEEKYPVMVLENGDERLSLSLIVKDAVPSPGGKSGRLYIQTPTGISEFQVAVSSFSQNTFYTGHGEKLSDIQRRNFFRKAVGLSVIISIARDPGLPFEAALSDLSGGGLSFTNQAGLFKPGDEIFVDFQNQLKTNILVRARVVRISKGNKVVHAEFIDLKAKERDLIIGALNR